MANDHNYMHSTINFDSMIKSTEGGQGELMTKKKRRCGGPMSKLMIFTFIVMITGFTFATPFSLLLTIPAYVLADRVSINTTTSMYHVSHKL